MFFKVLNEIGGMHLLTAVGLVHLGVRKAIRCWTLSSIVGVGFSSSLELMSVKG